MTTDDPAADELRRRLVAIVEEARRVQSPEYPNASTDEEVVDAILAATVPEVAAREIGRRAIGVELKA
jgi:hypothetical protein